MTFPFEWVSGQFLVEILWGKTDHMRNACPEKLLERLPSNILSDRMEHYKMNYRFCKVSLRQYFFWTLCYKRVVENSFFAINKLNQRWWASRLKIKVSSWKIFRIKILERKFRIAKCMIFFRNLCEIFIQSIFAFNVILSFDQKFPGRIEWMNEFQNAIIRDRIVCVLRSESIRRQLIDYDANSNPYFARHDELTITKDCLLWGNRIIFPRIFRDEVLNLLH